MHYGKSILYLAITMTSLATSCGFTNSSGYLKSVRTTKRCVPEKDKFLASFLRWQFTYQCYAKEENKVTGKPGPIKGLEREVFYGGCHSSKRSLNDSFYVFSKGEQNDFSKECEISADNGDKYQISVVQNDSAQVFKIEPNGTSVFVENLKCTSEARESDIDDKDDQGCDNQNASPFEDSNRKSVIIPNTCRLEKYSTEFYSFTSEEPIKWCTKSNGLWLENRIESGFHNAACLLPSKTQSGAAIARWLGDQGAQLEKECEALLMNIDI